MKTMSRESRKVPQRKALDRLTIYENLYRFNGHMEQAVAVLASLSAQLTAERANISYYRLAIEEARSGVSQGILESMNASEIAQNGRLSRQRRQREKVLFDVGGS